MNMTDLPIDEAQIAAILRNFGVVQASVFGSFARGDADPTSDLALLVTYKSGTTPSDKTSLHDELEKQLGRKVMLISRQSLSDRLAKRIEKDIRPLISDL